MLNKNFLKSIINSNKFIFAFLVAILFLQMPVGYASYGQDYEVPATPPKGSRPSEVAAHRVDCYPALKEKVNTLTTRLEQLDTEKFQLIDQNQSLSHQLSQKDQDIGSLQREVDEKKSVVEHLEGLIEQKNSAISELLEELKENNESLRLQQRMIIDKDDEINRLKQQVEILSRPSMLKKMLNIFTNNPKKTLVLGGAVLAGIAFLKSSKLDAYYCIHEILNRELMNTLYGSFTLSGDTL